MNILKRKIINFLLIAIFLATIVFVIFFFQDGALNLVYNRWVRYLVLPLLIALSGAWLWRLGIFFGVEKWIGTKKKVRQSYKSEKELIKRISKIKNLQM